jgi:hypothetical protein
MTGEFTEVTAEGIEIWNSSNVPTSEVLQSRAMEPVMAALVRWSSAIHAPPTRQGNLFDRDRYVNPGHIFDEMRLAYTAAERDDVVAGVLEATESLAFAKMDIFAEDPDEEDVYNQIAGDLDLDSRLREMWRELFIVSQFAVAIWWGQKTYKVRGKTEKGVSRKKEFNLRVPLGMTMLDPLKVIPVGMLAFGREQLAYMADGYEVRVFDDVLEKRNGSDPLLERLLVSKYEPTLQDMEWMAGLKTGTRFANLYLLNSAMVFRHTATRPQYSPFATVRMKSVFELLDLKSQLRQMDRAHLIGGTNFIVVVTKGSDQLPAKPQEITNLQAQVRTVARLPVLVGDHRLNVEIVTPKLDNTLKAERYNAIDGRITARLMLLLSSGAYQAGTTGDDSIKLTKVIARGLESRRHMLRRTLEKRLFDPLFEGNESLTSRPKLRFHPKNIALDFDINFATFLADLRATNDISRETLLSQFDIDQDDEAKLVEREREFYDDIFRTAQPFDSPENNQQRNPQAAPGLQQMPKLSQPQVKQPGPGKTPPGGVTVHVAPAAQPAQPAKAKPTTPAQQRRAGRAGGGNRSGGGAAPGTGQGQAPKNPRRKSD